MIAESDVRAYLSRALAIVNGARLDYVSILRRESAKSWPEHASVRADDRPDNDVIEEVLGHIADIADSARAENRASFAVRLRLTRAKQPAGSRTFNSDDGGSTPEEPEAGATPKEEMVATIRELRMLTTTVVSDMAMRSGDGFKIAFRVLEENAALRAENQRLSVELATLKAARGDGDDDGINKLMEGLMPIVLAKMAGSTPGQQ